MGDDDIHPLVMSKKGRSGQVMKFGKVSSPIPMDGQVGQLFQGPVVFLVTAPELIHVKVGFQRIGVDIEAFGKEIFPLLGVVLGLERIVEDFLWTDAHAIGWICHLVDNGICVINLPSLRVWVGAAQKYKILFIFHCAIQHLAAIFQPLA